MARSRSSCVFAAATKAIARCTSTVTSGDSWYIPARVPVGKSGVPSASAPSALRAACATLNSVLDAASASVEPRTRVRSRSLVTTSGACKARYATSSTARRARFGGSGSREPVEARRHGQQTHVDRSGGDGLVAGSCRLARGRRSGRPRPSPTVWGRAECRVRRRPPPLPPRGGAGGAPDRAGGAMRRDGRPGS